MNRLYRWQFGWQEVDVIARDIEDSRRVLVQSYFRKNKPIFWDDGDEIFFSIKNSSPQVLSLRRGIIRLKEYEEE